jgi:hypothetical protein
VCLNPFAPFIILFIFCIAALTYFIDISQMLYVVLYYEIVSWCERKFLSLPICAAKIKPHKVEQCIPADFAAVGPSQPLEAVPRGD